MSRVEEMSKAEKISEKMTRHGHATSGKLSPEYRSWEAMKRRCNSPKDAKYSFYGGKGIMICDRGNYFAVFLEDMGRNPSPSYTIERKNGDKNYEPSNCYWATKKEQAANRSSNRYITFNGRTELLKTWAREIGITSPSLRDRLEKWGIERALTDKPYRSGSRSNGQPKQY